MGTGLQTFIRRLDHPPGRHNDSGSLPSALQSASPSPIPSGAHAFRPSKSRGPSGPAVWSSAVTHTRAPCPVILSPCLCPRPSPQTRASVSPQGLPPPSPALRSYPRLTAQTAHHVQPAPQPHAPGPGWSQPRPPSPHTPGPCSPCSPPKQAAAGSRGGTVPPRSTGRDDADVKTEHMRTGACASTGVRLCRCVCAQVCVHAQVCAPVQVCVGTAVCASTGVCVRRCVYVHRCVHLCRCVCRCVCARRCVCKHRCAPVQVCVCRCVCNRRCVRAQVCAPVQVCVGTAVCV